MTATGSGYGRATWRRLSIRGIARDYRWTDRQAMLVTASFTDEDLDAYFRFQQATLRLARVLRDPAVKRVRAMLDAEP